MNEILRKILNAFAPREHQLPETNLPAAYQVTEEDIRHANWLHSFDRSPYIAPEDRDRPEDSEL